MYIVNSISTKKNHLNFYFKIQALKLSFLSKPEVEFNFTFLQEKKVNYSNKPIQPILCLPNVPLKESIGDIITLSLFLSYYIIIYYTIIL